MSDASLFVCVSRYTRPTEEVDVRRPAHLEWLERQYAEGRMLASGRQSPPVGGVLVLRADDQAAVEALLATDPYVLHDLAEYHVTAFEQTPAPLRSPHVDAFLQG